jgi:hypothetical protein
MANPPIHVALVPRGVKVDHAEVVQVAAALSIQVVRDFTPIWHISASVSPFLAPADVPVGYLPIYIEDAGKLPPGTSGVHLDSHNQPYALIEYDEHWSLHASHEMLEMLVDPAGNLVHVGPMLPQALALNEPAAQVQYIVEVADPVQDAQFAYDIDGILVSNFVMPRFYSQTAAPGTRYDHQGALSGPLQVLKNGYISWLDAQGNAKQFRNFADSSGTPKAQVLSLSDNAQFTQLQSTEGLRAAVDRVTGQPDLLGGLEEARRAELVARHRAARGAAAAQAAALHADIENAYKSSQGLRGRL